MEADYLRSLEICKLQREHVRRAKERTSNGPEHAGAWDTEGRESHPRPELDPLTVEPMLLHDARTRSNETRDSELLAPR